MDAAGHLPVLMSEVLSFVARPETGAVLDATLGLGGHAEAILKSMDKVKLIGMDKDAEAMAFASRRLAPFAGRATLVHSDFSHLGPILDQCGQRKVDAILFDLGVSSMQLDDSRRGFSFMRPGPLDMRMDQGHGPTAADLVASAGQRELAGIFRQYGEEPKASIIAAAIVRERAAAPIVTTERLAEIVARAANYHGGRTHPATRVFQALRIAVNAELDRLAPALTEAVERLNPEGRIAVISFHSLEDRVVKRLFADLAKGCVCPPSVPVCVCGQKPKLKILTKKPVLPQEAEVRQNPRARSARLRAAQKLAA